MKTKKIFSILLLTASFSIVNSQQYTDKTIQHDGLTRNYSVYTPSSYDGSTDFPTLLIFMEVATI